MIPIQVFSENKQVRLARASTRLLFVALVLGPTVSQAKTSQTKTTPAHRTHSRQAVGEDVRIEAGETVRDVMILGGDAYVAGIVTRDVFVTGGDISIESGAVVRRNVAVFGGHVHVKSGATVHGDVHTFGGTATIEAGATIDGEIRQLARDKKNGARSKAVPRGSAAPSSQPQLTPDDQRELAKSVDESEKSAQQTEDDEDADDDSAASDDPDDDGDETGASFLSGWWSAAQIASTLLVLLFVAALAFFFPNRVKATTRTLESRFPAAALSGVGIAVAIVPVTVLLIITIVGIAVVPFAIALLFALYAFGYVALAYGIGRRIQARRPSAADKSDGAMWQATMIGALVLAAVSFVPIFGALIAYVASTFAAGAVLLCRFGSPAFAPIDLTETWGEAGSSDEERASTGSDATTALVRGPSGSEPGSSDFDKPV